VYEETLTDRSHVKSVQKATAVTMKMWMQFNVMPIGQSKIRMIYSVKSSRYVKKSQTSDLLMTHGFDDMIMNGESSFSRMHV